MKKVVLKLEVYDEKSKKKAMRAVSGLEGLESISMDMKDKKLTVTGDIDPVELVARLRKLYGTEIVSVGLVKQEEKKEKKKDPMDEMTEHKADQAHYPRKSPKDEKKVEPKKEEPKKKDPKDELAEIMRVYQAQYPPMPAYYAVRSSEEDPKTCVIC